MRGVEDINRLPPIPNVDDVGTLRSYDLQELSHPRKGRTSFRNERWKKTQALFLRNLYHWAWRREKDNIVTMNIAKRRT